jgi:Tol biopolymer transport system component
MSTFFQKLGGRDVTRVVAAYLAIAWLAIEVIVTVSEPLGLPGWINRAAIITALIGLPIAIVLAWTYRLTPEGGIERESDSPVPMPVRIGGRQIDFVIIGALVLAVVFLLVNARFGDDPDGKPVITSIRKLTDTPIYLPPETSPFPLVIDDSRIYFDYIEGGDLRIGQVARAGGEVLPLEEPFDDPNMGLALERLSPDKSALVVNLYEKQELWEVPIVGGSPRKIGDAYQSEISPDGAKMIFRRGGRTDLFLANADMSDARKVFTGDARSLYWLRFSPDGKRVRFTLFFDHHTARIWEYSLELDQAYPVLPDWDVKSACCGSWTPDGNYYVFEAVHEGGPQIWAIEDMPDGTPDPGGPFQLTSGVMDFKRPTISEDGKTIYAIGWQLRGEVVERRPGDDHFHPIDGLEALSVEHVDFSLDGEWAAFVSYPDGHLWRKRLADDGASQLTFGSMRTGLPRISPNGELIAFEGWEPVGHNRNRRIFTIPIDGGNASNISDPEVYSFFPSWSPDGTKLLFNQGSETTPVIYDLLTNTTGGYGGPVPILGATWSPDGSKLLGLSDGTVVIYDFDKGEFEPIIEYSELEPQTWSWSADSKHVYFIGSMGEYQRRTIYRLNIHDKVLEKMLHVGNERAVWGTRGRWIGVSPAGSVMYLRDHSIHNIYALDWNVH